MRETVEKDIDGLPYTFQHFPTTVSVAVLAKMTRIFGEPIMAALAPIISKKAPAKLTAAGVPEKVKAAVAEAEVTGEMMTKLAGLIASRMDEDEIVELVKKFAHTGVKCQGESFDFDDHYAGNPSHLFKVVKAGLEVQYGNFFGARKGPVQSPQVTRTVALRT